MAAAPPAPWNDQIRNLPYNTTTSEPVQIANSTYFVQEMGFFPYEWYQFLLIFAFVFMILGIYVPENSDIASLISAVLFYVTAYMSEFVMYRFYSAFSIGSDGVIVVPWFEVNHYHFMAYVCLGLALVMTIYFISRILKELHDTTTGKKSDWVAAIFGSGK